MSSISQLPKLNSNCTISIDKLTATDIKNTFFTFLHLSNNIGNKNPKGLNAKMFPNMFCLALRTAAFFPRGLGGVAGSMLIVMFAYAGFEVIGLAASETGEPHRTIPRAILYTVVGLVGLYILVIAALLPLVPTSGITATTSPMVSALRARGLAVAAGTVNIILITAIISTMLAATFGLGWFVPWQL